MDGIGIPVSKLPIKPKIVADLATPGKDEYRQYNSSKKRKVATSKPLETISLEAREKKWKKRGRYSQKINNGKSKKEKEEKDEKEE